MHSSLRGGSTKHSTSLLQLRPLRSHLKKKQNTSRKVSSPLMKPWIQPRINASTHGELTNHPVRAIAHVSHSERTAGTRCQRSTPSSVPPLLWGVISADWDSPWWRVSWGGVRLSVAECSSLMRSHQPETNFSNTALPCCCLCVCARMCTLHCVIRVDGPHLIQ